MALGLKITCAPLKKLVIASYELTIGDRSFGLDVDPGLAQVILRWEGLEEEETLECETLSDAMQEIDRLLRIPVGSVGEQLTADCIYNSSNGLAARLTLEGDLHRIYSERAARRVTPERLIGG